MIKIEFINNTNISIQKWESLAKKICKQTLILLNLNQKNIELSIIFETEENAQKMNMQYRHKKYIPDVLTFLVEMSEQEIQSIGIQMIGDIIICFEEAQRKANKLEHKLEEEMGFLFTHGILHLLGYDHETNQEDEKEMFALQDNILESVGLKYEIKFSAEDYEQ